MNNDIQEETMEQLIRKKTVQEMVADMPSSTLYYLIKNGDFPGPVRLGKRGVAWKKREILEWINSRERSMIQGGES